MQPVPEQQTNRTSIATYDTYAQAQKAVDYLSDNGFPVERLTIIGTGLQIVENVTGRLTYASAAVQGLISGAITGAFIGLFLGLLSLFDPSTSALVLVLYGALFGAVIGLVFGLLGYSLTGGRRDFSSVQGMQATRYELLADPEVAQDAVTRLGALKQT